MKIYLAKSNKANYDVVALTRKHLTELGHEIVEFKGGDYSPLDLENSDACVAIVDQYSATEPIIGRGLFEQMNICLFKTAKTCVVVNADQINEFIVHRVLDTKLIDSKNWVAYGRAVLEPKSVPFSMIIDNGKSISSSQGFQSKPSQDLSEQPTSKLPEYDPKKLF